MNDFFGFLFFAALAGSAYFAVKLIIAHIKKQNKQAYLKKFGIAFATVIVAFVGFALTQTPEQIAKNQAKRAAEEQLAEEKKLAEEKLAAEQTEKKAAEEKQAAEQAEKKKAEEEKQAALKAQQDAERKAAEEKAQAEKQKAEELKKQQERQAAEEKRRQEEAAKQARIAAEQTAFQNWNAQIQQGIEAVDDHWEQMWQYTLNDLSNGNIDVQTAFLTLRDLEHKLIDDEMIFYNASIPSDVSSQNRDAMNKVRQGLQAWAQARRKACEKFRISLGSGNLNQTTMQETMDMINTSNAVMLRSAAELAVLQNKFGTP